MDTVKRPLKSHFMRQNRGNLRSYNMPYSSTMLFTNQIVNGPKYGLSYEILCILALTQWAANLPNCKIEIGQEPRIGAPKTAGNKFEFKAAFISNHI